MKPLGTAQPPGEPAAAASAASSSSGSSSPSIVSVSQSLKPWQLLASRLDLNSPFDPSECQIAVIDVLDQFQSMLTPVSMAEIVILIGRLVVSSQHFHEQLINTACTMLLDAIQRSALAGLPFEWSDAFSAISEADPDLKITSLECFAFIVELHRLCCPAVPQFPAESIGFAYRWSSRLSRALFVKWVVVAVTITSPTSPVSHMRVPYISCLQGVDISGDDQLYDSVPPGFINPAVCPRMWSNGSFLSVLLELTDLSASTGGATTQEQQSEDIQAATASFELLKRPTINSPELILATLMQATYIAPAAARPLAADCVDNVWKRAQSKITNGDLDVLIRWLASLNPPRFSSIVIWTLYTRSSEKVVDIVAALDRSLLASVLEGPPAPYKFHVAQLAWSSEFNAAEWLRQRLLTDSAEDVATEFLLFLILHLCPIEILEQQLPPGACNPKGRLNVRPHELWLYLATIVSHCAKPGLIPPAVDYDQTVGQLLAKPRDVFDAELSKLKLGCARLLPQLAGFVLLLQPSRESGATTEGQQMVSPSAAGVSPPQTTSGTSEETGSAGSTPPEEESAVQQEVHRYFVWLYTDEITPDGMLEIMKKFSRAKPGSHDYQVFNHMIRLLFHECRFFPKYPLTELAVTAQLLGRMIRDEILVGHGPGGSSHLLAIWCIVVALQKGETTKMFKFGITALQQFIDSPVMVGCVGLLVALSTSLPDVRKHFPHYVEYAEKCLALIPAESRKLHYLSRESIASLPFRPPPLVTPHPEFTLSPHQQRPPSAPTAAALGLQDMNQDVTTTTTVGGATTTTDALPPQRPLVVDGKPVALSTFSLGSVERLLSSAARLGCGVSQPPQWMQDRVAQIFNSLVQTNLGPKAEELRRGFQSEWFVWLALYIVKSRASKETNFQILYINFLEALGWPQLVDCVVSVTYESLNCLLSYVDAAKESSSYRTVLKNLGSWLGAITLARNIPLRGKSIDIKMVLLDGYENGRLKALLPFCCKILDGVGRSRTLRPPNPWTVANFNLLGEIHSLPGLATPLVFEIEVLFKNLHLQVSDYKNRSSYLSKRPLPPFNSPDFTKREVPQSVDPSGIARAAPGTIGAVRPTGGLPGSHLVNNAMSAAAALNGVVPASSSVGAYQMPRPEVASSTKFSHPGVVMVGPSRPDGQLGTPSYPAEHGYPDGQASLVADASLVKKFGPAQHLEGSKVPLSLDAAAPAEPASALLAGLMNSVVISPALVLFQLKPALKAAVPRAIERAIKEIVQIVAERSVTISCVATKELICKDFAAEPSESLVRRASHLMVASLAGSLAIVTCGEPLRAAMCQHLKALLLAGTDKLGEDQRLVDQVIGVISADNMELGCTLVEHSVIQRALQEIEVTMQKPLAMRRQCDSGGDQPFMDMEYFNQQRWPTALPEALRPRSALTGDHLQVYKDFLTFGPLQKMQQSSSTLTNFATPTPETQPQSPPGVAATVQPQPPSTSAATEISRSLNSLGNHEAIVLMRVEAALSQIKDIIHEVAFCCPVLSVKVTAETKFPCPLGAFPEASDVPPCVNSSLSILCRLPSFHELFSLVPAVATCCSSAKSTKSAILSVVQRVLKMITDTGALYRQHLIAKGTSDAAGLYLEVFLATLDQLVKLEEFCQQQFRVVILAWLPSLLSDRRYAPDIVIGLLRYKLISFALADQLLVEQCLSGVEKRETVIFENVLKILHRIAIQSGIKVDDLQEALDGFKECRELLKGLNVAPVVDTASAPSNASSSSSLGTVLSRVVVSLESKGLQYFAEARLAVLDEINAVFEGGEVFVECTHNQPLPAGEEGIITTFTQLIDNYATLGTPIVRVRRLPAPAVLTAEKQQQFSALFDQWTVCALVVGSERRSKVWAEFFQTLSKSRLLQMDDDTDRFFSGCVDRAIQLAQEQPEGISSGQVDDSSADHRIEVDTPLQLECHGLNMKPIDMLAKMVVAMMRLIDPTQIAPVLILQRVLSVISRSIRRDAELSVDSLPQKLYFRLLLSLMWEVGQPGRGLDNYAVPCLLYFSSTCQVLNPCECPAFAFCWLELISHRAFMPKMLRHLRGWPHYHRLLVCLLRFLYPILQEELTPSVQALYKGVLRLLLILLHDFPEFLCEHYIDLCEQVPCNAIQFRNLILSAFPRNIKLPDPFQANLKIDQLADIRRVPQLTTNSTVFLARCGLDKPLQQCWSAKTLPESIVPEIISKIQFTDEKQVRLRNVRYNTMLINAILLHIVSNVSEKDFPFVIGGNSVVPYEESPLEARLLLQLALSLDLEGRYLLLSCMANGLRYPNFHTYYFGCVLLWMFHEAGAVPDGDSQMLQEQLTRVLLERLIAYRPHPWGLLITFTELIKNPLCNFWNRSFVHSAAQIKKLFRSVAQTCLVQDPQLLVSLDQQQRSQPTP